MTDFDAAKMTREEMKETIERLKKPVKPTKFEFAKETDLCAAFINRLPPEWVAYPETGGFDILLVRKEDGYQIGIEAKLKLNAKVISQVAERIGYYYITSPGPDFRAVLVPADANGDMGAVCGLLGITVIRQHHPDDAFNYKYNNRPELPKIKDKGWEDSWHEFAPFERLDVPDYVPDVIAGDAAPVQLTHWKIAAIKIAVTLEKRGYVTRLDFKHHQISMSRWSQGGWIIREDRDKNGKWKKGKLPDFKAQHPKNYVEIENDYETWQLPEKLMVATK